MRLRVGLTGGIGSGKSEVAKIFERHGALVIDADALARTAVAPGTAGLALIGGRWPETIAPDGTLDRQKMAHLVFHDSAARDDLNAIVHPEVRRLGSEVEAAAGPEQLVIHDVPLLFEAGFYRFCDANVLVVAERETRVARTAARSGLAEDEIVRRMDAQIDPARARELADYVLDNDGTLAALEEAVAEVVEDLRERVPSVSRATQRDARNLLG